MQAFPLTGARAPAFPCLAWDFWGEFLCILSAQLSDRQRDGCKYLCEDIFDPARTTTIQFPCVVRIHVCATSFLDCLLFFSCPHWNITSLSLQNRSQFIHPKAISCSFFPAYFFTQIYLWLIWEVDGKVGGKATEILVLKIILQRETLDPGWYIPSKVPGIFPLLLHSLFYEYESPTSVTLN